jgi:hypothetical protein
MVIADYYVASIVNSAQVAAGALATCTSSASEFNTTVQIPNGQGAFPAAPLPHPLPETLAAASRRRRKGRGAWRRLRASLLTQRGRRLGDPLVAAAVDLLPTCDGWAAAVRGRRGAGGR